VKECEEFDMSKANDFASNNKFARKFIQQGWPDLPEAYLAVACNEFHDFFFLLGWEQNETAGGTK
jgi:hypothetical protein